MVEWLSERLYSSLAHQYRVQVLHLILSCPLFTSDTPLLLWMDCRHWWHDWLCPRGPTEALRVFWFCPGQVSLSPFAFPLAALAYLTLPFLPGEALGLLVDGILWQRRSNAGTNVGAYFPPMPCAVTHAQ